MELLGKVEINQYVRLVTLSEKRRATYYEKGKKKLPAKYEKELNVNYKWTIIQGKTYLTDAHGERILSNPNSVGQPKGYVIKGNDLWSLRMIEGNKAKITKAIKEQMIKEIEKLDPIIKYPLRILCELHDTVLDWMYIDSKSGLPKETNWDVDNRGLFYCKIFLDVLQGTPMIEKSKIKGDKGRLIKTSKEIIPNDNRFYVTQPPVPLFVPIEDTTKRKLVFLIYHDDREIIKNHPDYANRRPLL